MDQSDQITSGKFFCQKSRDPDQENTFQKSGPELYIIAQKMYPQNHLDVRQPISKDYV